MDDYEESNENTTKKRLIKGGDKNIALGKRTKDEMQDQPVE